MPINVLHITLRAFWLPILFISFAHAARDPFVPVGSDACRTLAAPPQRWQLGGIIGREGDYRAWLVFDPERWVVRTPGERLDQYWRLDAVSALSITVTPVPGCLTPREIKLKGRLYEMADDPATPAMQAALR
ncbi:hypothetical protein [Erwinia tasmaniensis]|uniref:hypothetical protein n=1 Tax=Erwinia tasmaniensis TaxID=338565 RepID=UPI003A4E5F0D